MIVALRPLPLVPTAVLGLVTALGAWGASPSSAADAFVTFQSPSKSIGCLYSRTVAEPSFLRCDIRNIARRAPRPASCELDYGSAFGLTATGRARRICAGDTALDPGAKVLAYGATRHLGPFTCTARRTGMRCTTRAGHGFALSRERQKLF